jgi:hypothetical protein
MEWALTGLSGVDQLLECESRINNLMEDDEGLVVCKYDVTRFSDAFLVNVLRTHPLLIVGGVLQPSPLFVLPDEFLGELAGRRLTSHPVRRSQT